MRLAKNNISDCKLIDLSKTHKVNGNITVVENRKNHPFDVKRIYYLYDVPGGAERGGHAHYKLEQYIVAACGSFDVIIDDGSNRKRISLNRPNFALHIVPGLWRELNNFSSGSVCMVLASHVYDEKDYIRYYKDFIANKHDS